MVTTVCSRGKNSKSEQIQHVPDAAYLDWESRLAAIKIVKLTSCLSIREGLAIQVVVVKMQFLKDNKYLIVFLAITKAVEKVSTEIFYKDKRSKFQTSIINPRKDVVFRFQVDRNNFEFVSKNGKRQRFLHTP